MSDESPVVLVQDVTKKFGRTRALNGVSFIIRSGEFVALLGANGAGKSTLLQLLTGLFSPDSGRIEVLGHDIRRRATRALSGIGVVFQQQTLDLELSVQANLLYHADLHGIPRRDARQRMALALERYGLDRRARARTLSGGNRRRIELARALLHKPQLLLMDEATVGLDAVSRKALLQEMVRLKNQERLGILWTTHLVDELEHVDRLIVLERGNVLFDGRITELMALRGREDLETTLLEMMNGPSPNDPAAAGAVNPG